MVSPAATQPGRSGEYAKYEPSEFSITTRYSLTRAPPEARLALNARPRPLLQVCAQFTGDRHRSRLRRVSELPVVPLLLRQSSVKDPVDLQDGRPRQPARGALLQLLDLKRPDLPQLSRPEGRLHVGGRTSCA